MPCLRFVQVSSDNEDDFEIVPQEEDSDADMWDVEDENEDEIKQEKIRSMSRVTFISSVTDLQIKNMVSQRPRLSRSPSNWSTARRLGQNWSTKASTGTH